jgi:hypothetical protein
LINLKRIKGLCKKHAFTGRKMAFKPQVIEEMGTSQRIFYDRESPGKHSGMCLKGSEKYYFRKQNDFAF